MIALLNGESGGSVVRQLLAENPGVCYAHAMNLAEVYYVFLRRGGRGAAENAIQDLLNIGIILRDDLDPALWKDAASLKGQHSIALPDGLCLALAKRIGGTAVTTDHKEFDPLVHLGIVPIEFIR
jgi:predicted nucleic acid-binding protein